MGRIIQQKGEKGSLKWIQFILNNCPDILDNSINKFLPDTHIQPIEWLSSLADDDYAEYQDQAFLDLLEIELTKKELKDFWPLIGPQWDALGRIKNEAYFLVEAKAHVSEIISSSQAKAKSSVSLINKSLREIKNFLNLKPGVWISFG